MEYVRCPPPFTVDTNLNEQTSFNNTGKLLAWLLDIDSACADTVTKCVLEIHLALECHIATLMSESVSLWMGIDGSGTTKQRNLTELEFGGFHLTKGTWSYLSICKRCHREEQKWLQFIVNTIDHFRNIQDTLNLHGRRTSLSLTVLLLTIPPPTPENGRGWVPVWLNFGPASARLPCHYPFSAKDATTT